MEFNEVVDVPSWQRMQDAAADALGVPVFTIDTAGRQLVLSGQVPDYTQALERKSLILTQRRAKELSERTEPHTFECQSGMHYAIAPVYVSGNLLCAIVAGPIRLTENLDDTAIMLAKLADIHSDDLMAYLPAMPMSTNETLASAQTIVQAIAKILPESSIYRKQSSRQMESLRMLLEFSNQLGTQLALEPLFTTTVTFCVKQLGVQDAAVWYKDKRIRFAYEEDRNALCTDVERRLLAQVLNANSMVHIPDARNDFLLKGVVHIEALPNSLYAMPLQLSGKAEGMLVLYAPVGAIIQSTSLLQGIAQRLSASVEKAQSLRTAQETAVTDPLTGLYNKRYFLEGLKNECTRARQFGRPTSLLILDLDDFKSYNDTYGHPAGDKLLREIGTLIKQNANLTDIACRYGGEEFTVIMPETTPEHAHLRAEKLRSSIEAHPFDNRKCTVSVGVVACMKSTSAPDTILKEADKAMYHSKKTGKNKVSTMIIVDKNLNSIEYDAPMMK